MPAVPSSAEPNHALNFKVPELNDDEAVAACYMQLEAKIVDGGEVFAADNWLPNCRLIKNKNFLSAMGFSPAFPKGNLAEKVLFAFFNLLYFAIFLTLVLFAESSLAYIKESDQEMA